MKKVFSLLLAVCLIVASVSASTFAVTENPFNDTENHWAKELLIDKFKQGLIAGYPDGSFRPDEPISKAEMVAIINRNFGLSELADKGFEDVDGSEWYKNEADKAYYYHYVDGKELEGEKLATGLDALKMIGNLLDLNLEADYDLKSPFESLETEDVALINRFAELGYLKGLVDDESNPNKIVKRAELMALSDNILGYLVLSQSDVENIPEEGKVTIIGQDIKLEGKEIEELYISPGVNSGLKLKNIQVKKGIEIGKEGLGGSLILDDVTAKEMRISPKARNLSVKIEGKSEFGKIITENNGEIRVGEKARTDEIIVERGAEKIEIANVGNELILNGGEVSLVNSRFKNIEIRGESSLEADDKTIIEDLDISAPSEIKGNPKIKKVGIHSDSVKFDNRPEFVGLDEGVVTDISDKRVSEGDIEEDDDDDDSDSQEESLPEPGTQVISDNGSWRTVKEGEVGEATGIWSVEDLASIGNENLDSEIWGLDRSYVLMEDLDFRDSGDYRDILNTAIDADDDSTTIVGIKAELIPDETRSNLGFRPIGDIEAMNFVASEANPFTGKFDGNNKVIANLYINRPEFDMESPGRGGITVGLFGGIMSAEVKSLGLVDVDIRGGNRVGALVGGAMMSSISNCYVSGKVQGFAEPELYNEENDFVGRTTSTGGLIGMTFVKGITIIGCHSSADVKGTDAVGGLIGYNYGNSMTNCYSSGRVEGDHYVGGLSGCNIGTAMKMGPTVRIIEAEIQQCYSSANVEGENDVGGLVGYNHVFSNIENCYSTGDVEGDRKVGGVVGENNLGSMDKCYATGKIRGTSSVGGVVGEHRVASRGGAAEYAPKVASVTNCIALNKDIISEFSFGRVIGSKNDDNSTSKNNYSYSEVLVNGESISNDDSGDKNGDDASFEEVTSSDFYSNDKNWDMGEGRTGWKIGEVWIFKSSASRLTLIGVGEDDGYIDLIKPIDDKKTLLKIFKKIDSTITDEVYGNEEDTSVADEVYGDDSYDEVVEEVYGKKDDLSVSGEVYS